MILSKRKPNNPQPLQILHVLFILVLMFEILLFAAILLISLPK
ncbi:hypothetical protein UFOVP579_50 [uncultured Caudovirales phage]|uniref:Uncharacterized protein n=1 Tax=uncultured Caudovirales phage TaxID=2100421 RepID=A0A6J5LT24_9CAUD|nr:hypothetical protein UFOVP302_50 [uncultured Caudovirales phage]CAB4168759.1 hypothetical protein UFOVP579_50 [uncultured Caudovirales phage]